MGSARLYPKWSAAVQRRYSAGEKRALLAEADRCKAAGTLGAFLRSKRIYSSMLSSWQCEAEAGSQSEGELQLEL